MLVPGRPLCWALVLPVLDGLFLASLLPALQESELPFPTDLCPVLPTEALLHFWVGDSISALFSMTEPLLPVSSVSICDDVFGYHLNFVPFVCCLAFSCCLSLWVVESLEDPVPQSWVVTIPFLIVFLAP